MHARKQARQLDKLHTHKQSLQQPPCSNSSLLRPRPCSSPTRPLLPCFFLAQHVRHAGTPPCRPRCVPTLRAAPGTTPCHPTPRPTSLQSCSPAMSSRRSCRQRCYRLSYKLSTVCVDAELLHHTPSPLLSLPSAPIKERGRAELRPSPKLASPLRSACCSSSQSSLPSTHETKPRPSTLSLSHSAPR